MKQLLAGLLLAAISAATTPAQVFVVDVNNGPGTNFTSIAAAVTAVPDGAVLQVRSGTYGGFAIQNKSLTVLGDPGVIVQGMLTLPIAIANLTASQFVTLRRLIWSHPLGPGTLSCQNCAGTILIDECRADTQTSTAGGGLVVSSCDRVFLRNSRIEPLSTGMPCIQSTQSNLTLLNCWLRSQGFILLQTAGRVHLTDSWVESNGFFGLSLITMTGGTLVINGGGTLMGSPYVATAGIVGVGTVALDPNTNLLSLATPAIGPGITIQNRAIPRLDATTQGIGGSATATLDVASGSIGFLLAGFAASPYAVPGLADPIWLAPGAVLQTVGGSPSTTSSYAVPNANWVLGIQIAWQGAVLGPRGAITASNPVVYVHH